MNKEQRPQRPTLNEEDRSTLRDVMVMNMMQRNELLRKLSDPRRDIPEECGWPDVNSISAEQYKGYYDENCFAERVVDIYPAECWQIQPTVYETEDTEDETEFEKSWAGLAKSLHQGSKFNNEEGSLIWKYLYRLDKLCGIGTYGVLLIGIDDGKELHFPAPGFEDLDSFSSTFGSDQQYDYMLTP